MRESPQIRWTPSDALIDMFLWMRVSPLCREYNNIYIYIYIYGGRRAHYVGSTTCTELNGFNHYYVTLTIQFRDTIKKFQVLLIIIMSRHQHGYPWSSLATTPYRPSLSAGLQGYIPYRHRAAICRFELIALPLLGHVKGSTRVHHLWARLNFSSNVPHVRFI